MKRSKIFLFAIVSTLLFTGVASAQSSTSNTHQTTNTSSSADYIDNSVNSYNTAVDDDYITPHGGPMSENTTTITKINNHSCNVISRNDPWNPGNTFVFISNPLPVTMHKTTTLFGDDFRTETIVWMMGGDTIHVETSAFYHELETSTYLSQSRRPQWTNNAPNLPMPPGFNKRKLKK
jgi:hypothetical protein